MSEPNSFSDFCERFNKLRNEANSYGVNCLIVIQELNLLDTEHETGSEKMTVSYSNGPINAFGMSEYARVYIRYKMLITAQAEDDTESED